jgi:hypothetical protein
MTLSAQSNFDFVGSLNLVEGNEAIKVLKTELRQIVTSSTYAAKDVGLSPTGNLSNGLLEEVFLTKSIETIAEGKTTVEAINITGNAMVDQGHPLESIQLLIANLLLKLN